MNLETLDINGAVRTVCGSAALCVLSAIIALAIIISWWQRRQLPTRTEKIQLLVALVLAVLTGINAYLCYAVRYLCRPLYYIGCGVNEYAFVGVAVAAAILVIGWLALLRAPGMGCLVFGYGLLCNDYMGQFSHMIDVRLRIVVVAVAMILIVVGACNATYKLYRHRSFAKLATC